MLLFLFILLLCAALSISYYFANKMSDQHKQIILLRTQNDRLKNKIIKNDHTSQNIKIKYMEPPFEIGTTCRKCRLYLCPMEDSIILADLEAETVVNIHDSAEVSGVTWFQVSFLCEEGINNKGWLQCNEIKSEKLIT